MPASSKDNLSISPGRNAEPRREYHGHFIAKNNFALYVQWICIVYFHTGWWYAYRSEKHESQLGFLFPTEWENKIHVPNHQPAYMLTYNQACNVI